MAEDTRFAIQENEGIAAMIDMTLIMQREELLWQRAEDLVLENIEQFRSEATALNDELTPAHRKLLSRIETKKVSAYDFLTTWHDTFRSSQKTMRSRAVNDQFVRAVSRDLQFTKEDASVKAFNLMKEREDELVDEFLTRLYIGGSARRVIKATKTVLCLSDKELAEIYDGYIKREVYIRIAAKHTIVIFDPHASWLVRYRTKKAIYIERSRRREEEETRLQVIEKRLAELLARDDRLLQLIAETKIDIVTILAARTEYEKRLNKLSGAEARNPVKKMDIYTKVTSKLRDESGERYGKNTSFTLATAQRMVQAVDGVLIRVFDLSNSGKNELLVHMKEMRELTKEKEQIMQSRHKQSVVSKCVLWY